LFEYFVKLFSVFSKGMKGMKDLSSIFQYENNWNEFVPFIEFKEKCFHIIPEIDYYRLLKGKMIDRYFNMSGPLFHRGNGKFMISDKIFRMFLFNLFVWIKRGGDDILAFWRSIPYIQNYYLSIDCFQHWDNQIITTSLHSYVFDEGKDSDETVITSYESLVSNIDKVTNGRYFYFFQHPQSFVCHKMNTLKEAFLFSLSYLSPPSENSENELPSTIMYYVNSNGIAEKRMGILNQYSCVRILIFKWNSKIFYCSMIPYKTLQQD
jgi:hypothetical protein